MPDRFAEHFDGFSIGTNDLTQLVLGVDRHSAELSEIYDERNEAVRRQVRQLVETAPEADRKVGICGEAPRIIRSSSTSSWTAASIRSR